MNGKIEEQAHPTFMRAWRLSDQIGFVLWGSTPPKEILLVLKKTDREAASISIDLGLSVSPKEVKA